MKKGSKFTEEHKNNLSKAHKGQKAWNKGIPQTEDAKNKISEAKRGIAIHSEEFKAALAKRMNGNTYGRVLRGKIVSVITRNRTSESMKGNVNGSGGKGKIITIGQREAISKALKGRKHTLDFKVKQAQAIKDGKIGFKLSKRLRYTSKAGQQITFRSSWEYKVAVYLDKLGCTWIYEWDILTLDNEVYLPDFFIFDEAGNCIKVIEVKGYFPEKDKIIFNEFQQALADLSIELELWDESKLKELKLL